LILELLNEKGVNELEIKIRIYIYFFGVLKIRKLSADVCDIAAAGMDRTLPGVLLFAAAFEWNCRIRAFSTFKAYHSVYRIPEGRGEQAEKQSKRKNFSVQFHSVKIRNFFFVM
jgi:hypothetical protein